MKAFLEALDNGDIAAAKRMVKPHMLQKQKPKKPFKLNKGHKRVLDFIEREDQFIPRNDLFQGYYLDLNSTDDRRARELYKAGYLTRTYKVIGGYKAVIYTLKEIDNARPRS
jgi:hypothetical protein